MSLNLNKAIIAGRLTADPELKTTQSGINVTTVTVAVNRKTTAGEPQKADFLTVIAWRGAADFICKYFSKGSAICVTGNIQTRNWEDKNGGKHTAVEIVADGVDFVESKATANNAQTSLTASENKANFEEISSDDDLPF